MHAPHVLPGSDATHEVLNQSAPLENYNLFSTNRAMRDALAANGGAMHAGFLETIGVQLGSAQMFEAGALANQFTPQLKTHDRFGRRIDQVEFHPAYHALMRAALGWGLHTEPWAEGARAGHVRRAAAFMLFTEVEASVLCPVSMTYAAIPALKFNPALAAAWLPKLYGRQYDPRFVPAAQKSAVTMGMGMTEKQGGSDVRANTTTALHEGRDEYGDLYAITGHKWFMSAPMCDAFLVLAQAPGGLTCFFLPRILPNGTVNAIQIQRLKDKLGNRANASSEVEFHGARAWAVGEEGRGVPTILEMGTMTRLDCSLGTCGLMRRSLALALNHASQRRVFGRLLAEQPLAQNVLADLALESEAATALALRLARAFDAGEERGETLLRRLLTPVAKFWICKRGAAFCQETMEMLGGNGYVEENGMARLYREMPLNSIWEGAGNIMCLDLLRALRKGPEALHVLAAELDAAQGRNTAYDRYTARLKDRIAAGDLQEADARRLAQEVALAIQASLLLRHAPEFVADGFCASRLEGDWGLAFGSLPARLPFEALIARAMPR
ncbi:MAG: putative acyl-CoA dehydrogenase [Betaproteobacteria bacterium]|nr:putative acyl-CoA dehydrogenase [Betaproteobacteria bacterium]